MLAYILDEIQFGGGLKKLAFIMVSIFISSLYFKISEGVDYLGTIAANTEKDDSCQWNGD